MAETVEKFEEDLYGFARTKGRRSATVRFGEPIDLKQHINGGRPRAVTAAVTQKLEEAIQALMHR